MKYLNMKKRKLTFLFLILLCFGNIGMAMADNTEVHQSQRKITGRVMDVNGELLIGVNVMEVGTGIQPNPDGTVDVVVSAGPNNSNGDKFYYINTMIVSPQGYVLPGM